MNLNRYSMMALVLLGLAFLSGCAQFDGRLAGYGCRRPPCVVDPRGVVAEPCCHCAPRDPTCKDTDACCQLQKTRETFFDSMYAWICECNCWPDSDCCHYGCR